MPAAIIGAKRYSNTYPSLPISFSIFMDGSTAAPGTSNPRPFGYESYVLTNCVITARLIDIDLTCLSSVIVTSRTDDRRTTV